MMLRASRATQENAHPVRLPRPASRDCSFHLIACMVCAADISIRACRHRQEHSLAAELSNLKGISTREIVTRTWAEIRADDVFGRAAQLAYYFFLALFPFLICVVASLSVFGIADRGRALLFSIFARVLAPPAFQLVRGTFDEIIRYGGPLRMSFGIIASLWSASMGMLAVMDTLNAAYNVKETRSLMKQYAVALGLTIAITILLVASVLVVVLADQVVGALLPWNIVAIAWEVTQWILGVALLLLAFSITYYFAPNLKIRRWHWITPGAVVGIFLLTLISIALRIYLHYLGIASSATYGSLGAVIVLLLTFYLSGVAVLSGGALNGVLESLAASPKNTSNQDSLAKTSAP
jgi:membrane protein